MKLLVANRGEIAIRAFRAAYELGIPTAALYAPEDRNSAHRVKADESDQLGEPGHPVRAYLDVEGVVVLAERIGADAIYPGYGFMSENPELARRCAEAGVTFVGPPAEVLATAGNKVRARDAAKRARVPVLAASGILDDASAAHAAAADLRFPLFVKAAAGGGGRGMRFVEEPDGLLEATEAAMREAEGAFGDRSVYLERAVVRPRHIEVQVLADAGGQVVHLFERDCSVQRRHQKVIELAPAPQLDPGLRDALCADAVRFAREIGYVNAGTVEFLVDTERGEYVFIEMNPRIQVEHTVTEETTDVDLVRSQLLIAGGATLTDLGLRQESLDQRGFALQCRITTENPSDGFRPDTGRISAYRPPGGAGVRLDEGSALDSERVWVIEDVRHVSGSLERFLIDRGETVVRPARRLMANARQAVRERGKSDPIDALARAALREGVETLPTARLAGSELEIRLLGLPRERLVSSRTRLINELRWQRHDLWPDCDIPKRKLIHPAWQTKVAQRLERTETTVRVQIARDMIARIQELTRTITQRYEQPAELVKQVAPQLLAQSRRGVLIAAKLIGEIAGIDRIASDAQLARISGCAPIPSHPGRPTATAWTPAATGNSTTRSPCSRSPRSCTTRGPRSTSPSNAPTPRPAPKRSEAANATSPAASTTTSATPTTFPSPSA